MSAAANPIKCSANPLLTEPGQQQQFANPLLSAPYN